MKYEIIFGDEKLFDGAPLDSVCVERFINTELVSVYVHHRTIDALLNTLIEREAVSCASNRPDIAMRRIIQEPKRWTLEDKLAGRLPEVGSMILFINDMKQVEFAGTDGGDYLWYFKRDSGAFGSAYFNCFKPIETTEEKSRRERDEWAKKASEFIDDELDCVNLVGEHVMRRFYNAMLSGELPMPKKGG